MKYNEVFKALADPNRRKIIRLLARKDTMTAGEIADEFTISKPAISDHLKILRNADLLYADKRGQYVYYHLNTTILQEIAILLFDLLRINEEEIKDETPTLF